MVSKKKKFHYSCEGGIEKSVPQDHSLSLLCKPCDAKRWFLGKIILSNSQTHDGFLKFYPCYFTQDVLHVCTFVVLEGTQIIVKWHHRYDDVASTCIIA